MDVWISRMARMKPERQKQLMPEQMVAELLAYIRQQFCPDIDAKPWGQMSHFIKRHSIMWAAAFIHGKGFTLPVAEYDKIMREIFLGIKLHGKTGSISYWPAYLSKCVQEHWRHNWEKYYEASKSMTTIADAAIVGLARTPVRSGPTVEPIAAALRVLNAHRRKPKIKPPGQLSLI